MVPESILVVAAIIRKDGKYLIAQRNDDGTSESARWEFPGGKVHAGERPEAALIREIKEELGIGIGNLRFFQEVSHITKSRTGQMGKHIVIKAYLADWTGGELKLTDCQDAKLVIAEDLGKFDFLDADREIIRKLKSE